MRESPGTAAFPSSRLFAASPGAGYGQQCIAGVQIGHAVCIIQISRSARVAIQLMVARHQCRYCSRFFVAASVFSGVDHFHGAIQIRRIGADGEHRLICDILGQRGRGERLDIVTFLVCAKMVRPRS